MLDWLPSNWCMNQHKNDLYFTKKSFLLECLPDLADQFLTGKGDDMCRKNIQGGVFYPRGVGGGDFLYMA